MRLRQEHLYGGEVLKFFASSKNMGSYYLVIMKYEEYKPGLFSDTDYHLVQRNIAIFNNREDALQEIVRHTGPLDRCKEEEVMPFFSVSPLSGYTTGYTKGYFKHKDPNRETVKYKRTYYIQPITRENQVYRPKVMVHKAYKYGIPESDPMTTTIRQMISHIKESDPNYDNDLPHTFFLIG